MVSELSVRVLCFCSAATLQTPPVNNARMSISRFLGKPQEVLFELPWNDGRLKQPSLGVTLVFFLDFNLKS